MKGPLKFLAFVFGGTACILVMAASMVGLAGGVATLSPSAVIACLGLIAAAAIALASLASWCFLQ